MDKLPALKNLKEIFHEMPVICILINEQLKIASINHYGCSQMGYQIDELVGGEVRELYNPEEWSFVEQNLQRVFQHRNHESFRWECTRRRKDSSHFWARDTARILISHESNDQILLISEDITETQYLINELKKQASVDSLTGLSNRSNFEKHLEQAILSAQTGPKEHTLCYIDLDQFKVVNDVCGHFAGDEMLRQVSGLLKREMRTGDIISRLGGDEFGILMLDCPLGEAYELSRSLLDKILAFKFSWEHELFAISASFGLVTITSKTRNAFECLRMADNACFAAKENGRKNIEVYNPSNSQMVNRSRMQKFASRINLALENNRFVLHHQKIKSLDGSDSVNHSEVLIRLLDENDELIFPNAFIPAVEYYGLSTKLDLWVIEHTLKLFSHRQDDRKTIININLSGHTLGDKTFVDSASQLLKQYRTPGLTVCFEITETAAIRNLTQAIELINHFRAFDCLFALDDFGSGFSSLAYLKSLPIDYLKIDGHFIKNLLHEPRDRALITAIHQVSSTFNIKTVAEFVENEKIAEIIKEIGIDYGQGYFIHKPEPIQ